MSPLSTWRTIFVTGGAGYIGSHCIVELLEGGYDVVAIDNFTNSVVEGKGESAALKRVEKITGKTVKFYSCDLLDRDKLQQIFNEVFFFFLLFLVEYIIYSDFIIHLTTIYRIK